MYYLFTDHLGSTSEVRRADGSLHSRQYYRAFGEERYTSGALPTDRTYTGQREIENGLVHYGARVYDPYLNRWLSPDSIIPESSQGIQAWDRYAYVNNSPVKYNDPSGYDVGCAGQDASNCSSYNKPIHNRAADMQMDITIGFAVDVNRLQSDISSDKDYAQYSMNPGSDAARAYNAAGAINAIVGPFADANLIAASDADFLLLSILILLKIQQMTITYSFQLWQLTS